MNIRLIAPIVAGAFLNSCVQSSANPNADLVAADNRCNVRQFDSATAKVDCLSQVEDPVIRKELPFAIDAYRIFQARRLGAATDFDRNTTSVRGAWKGFSDGTNQAAAVLVAHEPGFADANAKLRKELNAANVEGVCRQMQLTARMTCFSEITRAIWERDAPSTLTYYDQFQTRRMQLARDYDIISVRTGAATAIDRYNTQIGAALAEFRANATRAQQAAQQQAAERQAEARAKAAEAADRLANFIGTLAVGALAVVAVAGAARAGARGVPSGAAPFHCTSYTYTSGRFTDIDCQ